MKIYVIILILSIPISSVPYLARIQMNDLKPVKRSHSTEAERKTLMITNGFTSQGTSMYTTPPKPDNNFVFPIPVQVGTFYSPAASTTINLIPEHMEMNAPPANVRFINNGGSQQAMMPTVQYNQLFNRANSIEMHSNTLPGRHDLADRIYHDTKTNIELGRKNTHKLAKMGANLFTNYMKLGSGLMNTARKGGVALYAAKLNGDLSEAAATTVETAQQQQTAVENANPNNLTSPSLPATTSNYSSSYGTGFLRKI